MDTIKSLVMELIQNVDYSIKNWVTQRYYVVVWHLV